MTKSDALSTLNLLDITVVRVADWEEQDDRVVIIRPRPRATWYLLPFEWLRYLLAVRRIRLDAVGSAAWRACDGSRTTRDVASLLRSGFGEAAEPAEERLGQLVRRLRREGLLAYATLDESSARQGNELNPC